MNKLSQRAMRSRWLPFWMGVGLVALVVAAYLPATRAGFIWDDDAYVTGNPLLTASDGLRRIWFSLESPSQYFPLIYTMFYIERVWWGLNAAGYHWVNIVFHAANAVLAWVLFRRLGVRWGWVAAALFALHPVQVESVAWVSERKNVMMVFFFFLTVLTWVEATDPAAKHPRRLFVLSLFFYMLALFAKSTACTLPAALFLIIWWRDGKVERRQWARMIPFAGLGLAMGLLTIWWERNMQGTHGKLFSLGLAERLLVASHSICFQFGKLLLPVNLTFSYPRWTLKPGWPLSWGWLAACAGLAGAMWRARPRMGRGVEAAAWFYAATLAPVLGFLMLFTFRYSFVADHYQYLACAGPFALAGAGAARVADISVQWRRAMIGLTAMLLLVLGFLTWRQCHLYMDLETLWRDTLAKNPTSILANGSLGVTLTEEGRVEEGVNYYLLALEADPDSAEVHIDLANTYFKAGLLDRAESQYQRGLDLDPRFVEARNNLASILRRKGDLTGAACEYEKAIRVRPDFVQSLNNLAWILAAGADDTLHNGTRAVELAQKASALTGGTNAIVLRTLAAALARAGRFSEAEATARQAQLLARQMSNAGLANTLQSEISFYESNRAYSENAGN